MKIRNPDENEIFVILQSNRIHQNNYVFKMVFKLHTTARNFEKPLPFCMKTNFF